MKTKLFILILTLLPLTSWGKIIPTNEVRSKFIELLARDIPKEHDFLQNSEVYQYEPNLSKMEISPPENPLIYLFELEAGVDYYEVHLDLFYQYTTRYHLNAILMVDYIKTTDGQYRYRMLVTNSTFRKTSGGVSGRNKKLILNSYEWERKSTYY